MYSLKNVHNCFMVMSVFIAMHAGFSLGGLLACSVHAKVWNLPNISPHIKENLVCITFGQPHIPIPWLDDLAEDSVSTVHAVQFERDLVPRLLRLFQQHSKVA